MAALPLAATPTHSLPPVRRSATSAYRRRRRSPTTASRRGSIRETLPEYWFATHTDPPAATTADGPLPTGIVARHVSAWPGRSWRRSSRGCSRPTERRRRTRASRGPVADVHAGDRPSRCRIELLDRRAVVPGDPERARREGDCAGLHIQRNAFAGRSPVARVDLVKRPSSIESATHSPPAPNASASGLAPAKRDRLRHASRVVGSIRQDRRADRARDPDRPPPLAMLPGSPPTGIRSTTAPDAGSIRETAPSLGSATHTEPAPVVTAPGAPASGVDRPTRPELGVKRHDAARACGQRRRRVAAPAPSTNPDHDGPRARSSQRRPRAVRRLRDPRVRRRRRGAPSVGSCWRIRRWSSCSSGPGLEPELVDEPVGAPPGRRPARRSGAPRGRGRASARRAGARAKDARPRAARARAQARARDRSASSASIRDSSALKPQLLQAVVPRRWQTAVEQSRPTPGRATARAPRSADRRLLAWSPALGSASGACHEGLESVDIELARLDPERVAARVSRAAGRGRAACAAGTGRRQATRRRSAEVAPPRAHRSARSRETTSFACSSSTASSVRCLRPPERERAPSSETSSGPSTANRIRAE